MNWFRFYHDALNDPKVQRLPGETFKVWVNLLCLASDSGDRGRLPEAADCAFSLRLSEAEMDAYLVELLGRGLLDQDAEGLSIHNWNGRQKASDDVSERVRKHRSGPSNAETFHETDTKRSGNGLEEDKSREEKEKTREEIARPRAAKRATSVPEQFQPTEEMFKWARDELSIERSVAVAETPKFLDYHRAKGSTFKDWPAAWRTWMRNSLTFARPGNSRASPRPSALDTSMASVDAVFGAIPDDAFETTGVVHR